MCFHRLEAAFVGYDDFSFTRAGAMLALNTFGMEIVWVLAVLPACLIGASAFMPEVSSSHKEDINFSSAQQVGNVQDVATLLTVLRAGAGAAMSISAFDVVCSMICVAIHRRHLMVWAIFAPKFIVDVGLFVAQSVSLLVVQVVIQDPSDQREKRARSEIR